MNRDDIIRMMREALNQRVDYTVWTLSTPHLEAFANLVEAAVLERIKWNSIHSCHADCQNPACVIVREAVAAEREACARVCDRISDEDGFEGSYADRCAFAIRERGAP